MGDIVKTFLWIVLWAFVLGVVLFTGIVSWLISETAIKYWCIGSIIVISIVFIATVLEIIKDYKKNGKL